MITYNNIAELEQAKLLVGDIVQVLGEEVTGDRGFMMGIVRDARPTSGNRVVNIQDGKFVEIMPDLVIQSGDVSESEVTSTGSPFRRKLKDRFADVMNVKDFGAVGDGVTDDTAAIQAAFDSKNIKATAGNYRITKPIVVKSGTDYEGSLGAVFIQDYAGTNEDGTQSLFVNEHYTDGSVVDTDISFKNLFMKTGVNANRNSLLALRNVEGLTLKNIRTDKKTGGFSIWISAKNFSIDGVRVKSQYDGITNSDGIHFEYIEDGTVNDCNIDSEDDCLAFCYFPLEGIYTNPLGRNKPSRNVTVSNCILSSSSNGIRLGNSTLLGLHRDNLYHADARYENIVFNNIVFNKVGGDGYCVDMYEVRQNMTKPNDQIRFNNLIINDGTSVNQMVRIRGNPYAASLVDFATGKDTRNYNNIYFNGVSGTNGSFAPSFDIGGVVSINMQSVEVVRTHNTDNEFVTQLVDYLYIYDSKIRSIAASPTSNIIYARDFQKIVINSSLLQGSGQEVAGLRLHQQNLGNAGKVVINNSEVRGTVGGVISVNPLELDELYVDAMFEITGEERNAGLTSRKGDRGKISLVTPNATVFTASDCYYSKGFVDAQLAFQSTAIIGDGTKLATFPAHLAPINVNGMRVFATSTTFEVYPVEYSTSGIVARRGMPAGIYFISMQYKSRG